MLHVATPKQAFAGHRRHRHCDRGFHSTLGYFVPDPESLLPYAAQFAQLRYHNVRPDIRHGHQNHYNRSGNLRYVPHPVTTTSGDVES
jgi:hypothetical protein